MNDTMFSQDQKTPCPAISENIYQILIAYNRQTARGAMECDTLNSKNSFSLNRYCHFFLASTLRILAVKPNVLGEHIVGNGDHIAWTAMRAIKRIAKSMEMAARKSNKRLF